jgi:hypothetical protein
MPECTPLICPCIQWKKQKQYQQDISNFYPPSNKQLIRKMQALENNLVNSMDLLLNGAYDFEQEYARSIVNIAFNVSFSKPCIIYMHFFG